jgi:hypothetical protein
MSQSLQMHVLKSTARAVSKPASVNKRVPHDKRITLGRFGCGAPRSQSQRWRLYICSAPLSKRIYEHGPKVKAGNRCRDEGVHIGHSHFLNNECVSVDHEVM